MKRTQGATVERHLDGITVTLHDRYRGLLHLLFYCVIGAAIGLTLPMLFLFVFLTATPAWLSASLAILGVLAGSFQLGTTQDGGLANFLAQSISTRGGSILVSGLLSERRIPMVDVIAFDKEDCMLVTRDFRTLHLAPSQPPTVRMELAVALSEALTLSPDGVPADVPESLRRMKPAPQKLPH